MCPPDIGNRTPCPLEGSAGRPGWGGHLVGGPGDQLVGGQGDQGVGGPGDQGVGGPPGDQGGFRAGHPAVLCRGRWALVRRT